MIYNHPTGNIPVVFYVVYFPAVLGGLYGPPIPPTLREPDFQPLMICEEKPFRDPNHLDLQVSNSTLPQRPPGAVGQFLRLMSINDVPWRRGLFGRYLGFLKNISKMGDLSLILDPRNKESL